jgi:hypothetical protein
LDFGGFAEAPIPLRHSSIGLTALKAGRAMTSLNNRCLIKAARRGHRTRAFTV